MNGKKIVHKVLTAISIGSIMLILAFAVAFIIYYG